MNDLKRNKLSKANSKSPIKSPRTNNSIYSNNPLMKLNNPSPIRSIHNNSPSVNVNPKKKNSDALEDIQLNYFDKLRRNVKSKENSLFFSDDSAPEKLVKNKKVNKYKTCKEIDVLDIIDKSNYFELLSKFNTPSKNNKDNKDNVKNETDGNYLKINTNQYLKLMSTNDINEIIHQGDLFKSNADITNFKDILNKGSSIKYFVVTKSEFRYYRSKDAIITIQKPTQIIEIKNIKEVNKLDLSVVKNIQNFKYFKSKVKKHFFYIKYLNTGSTIIGNSSRCLIDTGKENDKVVNKVSKKNISSFENNGKGIQKVDYIFLAGLDESEINKWVEILNRLIA